MSDQEVVQELLRNSEHEDLDPEDRDLMLRAARIIQRLTRERDIRI